VLAEQSPKNEPSRRGNADYRWAEFDSEAYFNHYYGEPHPDDDRVVECAVEAIKQAPPAGRDLDIVDIGTGPNLIPLFCGLPRARSLTVWEYAESNLAWLEAELARDAMRPQWQHFWGVTRHAYGANYFARGEPDARAPRQDEGQARVRLQHARARMGRRHDVLLRGIDHPAPR
jgi:NNMT/PNMT/TEMT family